jgi:hypothetical protein
MILETANDAIHNDRNNDYGPPHQDFARTAKFWSAYLGIPLLPHDVAAMMSLLKISRISWSPQVEDHWVDLAGYAACGYEAWELTKDEGEDG